jgi:hypothetical protein
LIEPIHILRVIRGQECRSNIFNSPFQHQNPRGADVTRQVTANFSPQSRKAAKVAKQRKGENRIFSITHIPLRHFATFAALR